MLRNNNQITNNTTPNKEKSSLSFTKQHNSNMKSHSTPKQLQKNISSKQQQQLQQLLTCHICYCHVDKPVMCPYCQKLYCQNCIKRYLLIKPQCPHCRKHIRTVGMMTGCVRFVKEIQQIVNGLVERAQEQKCAQHGLSLNYFCKQCKQAVCCECKMFGTGDDGSNNEGNNEANNEANNEGNNGGNQNQKLEKTEQNVKTKQNVKKQQSNQKNPNPNPNKDHRQHNLIRIQKIYQQMYEQIKQLLSEFKASIKNQQDFVKSLKRKEKQLIKLKQQEFSILDKMCLGYRDSMIKSAQDKAKQWKAKLQECQRLLERLEQVQERLQRLQQQQGLVNDGQQQQQYQQYRQMQRQQNKNQQKNSPNTKVVNINDFQLIQQQSSPSPSSTLTLIQQKLNIIKATISIKKLNLQQPIKEPLSSSITTKFPPEMMIPEYQKHQFILQNFSKKSKQIIYSNIANMYGCGWRLKIYPSGNQSAKNQYLSVFIEKVSGVQGNENINKQLFTASTTIYQYQIQLLKQSQQSRQQEQESSSSLQQQGSLSLLNKSSTQQVQILTSHNQSAKMIREYCSSFQTGQSCGFQKFIKLDSLVRDEYLNPSSDKLHFVYCIRHQFFVDVYRHSQVLIACQQRKLQQQQTQIQYLQRQLRKIQETQKQQKQQQQQQQLPSSSSQYQLALQQVSQ